MSSVSTCWISNILGSTFFDSLSTAYVQPSLLAELLATPDAAFAQLS